MLRFQVQQILPNRNGDSSSGVEAISGVTPEGFRWFISQTDAIEGMKQGRWDFYVRTADGTMMDLVIGTTRDGHQYLKTVLDGEQAEHLLALPHVHPGPFVPFH